ncbi:PadR family transcriptional regulator [Peterkaempfera griseoplana]|uniref:PadR family transcriptional regulator n=1 Tax=Peterkaempfera griseoplana TaxID=66896 RepID=UPI0006E1F5F3|nr:PadR family transcriptional regulator [Peterkaempfera griseoplana]
MSLRHAVLGLLADRSGSGYDLLRTFQSSLANVWPATQSQLYTELNRLADAGLVAVTAEGPRGRKEYAITDAGRTELHHWLLEVEPERQRRSESLLRVFFLDQVTPEQGRTYLEREGRAAAAAHQGMRELAERIDADPDPLAVYGRLALEWGLRFTRMQQEWAQWAAEQITERGPQPQVRPPGH